MAAKGTEVGGGEELITLSLPWGRYIGPERGTTGILASTANMLGSERVSSGP